MNNNLMVMQQSNEAINLIDTVEVGKVAEVLNKIRALQGVVQQTLQKGKDYGEIAAGTKPTLLKPGAEKIQMLFGIQNEYEIAEKVEDYDKPLFAYTIKCILLKGGQKITEGVGSCNSREDKYRWRWVKEEEIPFGVDKLTIKNRVDNYGRTKYRIENEDVCSQANTILKMAKKRAYVDATLTIASLSEIFTQDLEDLTDFNEKEQLENMKPEEVGNMKVTFGKHKGKTLGEILKEAPDYIEWLAQNAKEAVMKKACEQLLQQGNKPANNHNTQANTQHSNSIPVDFAGTPFEENDFPPFDESDIPN